MSELEQMYVSGAPSKAPSSSLVGGKDLSKRNKYFDLEHRGSIFGLSNETPTLIAHDQSLDESDTVKDSINNRKGTMIKPLPIIDENNTNMPKRDPAN